MPLIYQVITGHKLPSYKKLFDCRCKAIKYVKDILTMAEKKLSHTDLDLSIRLTRIDDELCPEFPKLFQERRGKLKASI